jgi:arylformamidase
MTVRPPIDITVPLRAEMPTWPGSVGIGLSLTQSFAAGDDVNVSRLEMDVHTGTHVENALHFIDGGAPLEAIPLDAFVGPALVVDMPAAESIGADELEAAAIPQATERILLRTRNSVDRLLERREFTADFVALIVDGARWIAERRFRLVGVDYLSVQQYGAEPATHRALMEAGVAILEGANLADVAAGPHRLICLPIRLADAEAAPARAILEPMR